MHEASSNSISTHEVTALERAEAAVSSFEESRGLRLYSHRDTLVELIHAACVEHSNAELERKREALRSTDRLQQRLTAAENANDDLRRLIDETLASAPRLKREGAADELRRLADKAEREHNVHEDDLFYSPFDLRECAADLDGRYVYENKA